MLPTVDINPNDEAFVHSVLFERKVKVPSLVFDQSIWLKALKIITAKELQIIPLAGGFHILMSLYGSIGTIMSGSDIEQCFKVYVEKTFQATFLVGKQFGAQI